MKKRILLKNIFAAITISSFVGLGIGANIALWSYLQRAQAQESTQDRIQPKKTTVKLAH